MAHQQQPERQAVGLVARQQLGLQDVTQQQLLQGPARVPVARQQADAQQIFADIPATSSAQVTAGTKLQVQSMTAA